MSPSPLSPVSSIQGAGHVDRAYRRLSETLARLSSGVRLQRAADDPAGLAVVQGLAARVASLAQARRNIEFGTGLAEVAQGALGSQQALVSRMRELAVQAANGTLSDSDRAHLESEFAQLRDEVDRIAAVTEFAGQPALAGQSTAVQVGTGAGGEHRIALDTPRSDATALGLTGVGVATQADAQSALAALDSALHTLSSQKAQLGAGEDRLAASERTLAAAIVNTSAARSRIGDTDFAAEASSHAANQVRLGAAIRTLQSSHLLKGALLDLLA